MVYLSAHTLWMAFYIKFLWVLTFSVPEVLKNSIFMIATIPQALNINNYRTASAKSINLDIIRKFIKYSLHKVLVKVTFTFIVFEIVLFKGRSILSLTQWSTGSQRVTFIEIT